MGPVSAFGRLRVQQGRLWSASGAPVALHGMSLFWSQWGSSFFNPEVVKWLADNWKIDVIRAPLGVQRGGYATSADLQIARVRRVVDAAIESDIYVIVDWHAHDPEPDLALQFFTEFCGDYAHYPNVILELWNEPGPGYQWMRDIRPYHELLLKHLRRVAPETLMILGTEFWSQRVDVAAEAPVADEQVCYALHFYAATHGDSLRASAKRALALGACLFISEWGGCEADGSGSIDEPELAKWWELIARYGLSDVNWSIIDKAETSSALVPGASPLGGWPASELTRSGALAARRLQGFHCCHALDSGE